MSEDTWRVFATLLDLQRDRGGGEFTASVNDVASRAAVANGVAERELERLRAVGAVERADDGYRYEGLSVEAAGARLDTLEELDEDEREALADAARDGDVDPGEALADVHSARDAAERAMGSGEG